MTGAKLMSVKLGNCNLSSIEKPTVMVTNCPALARDTPNISRETSTRASKICMRLDQAWDDHTGQSGQGSQAP